MEPDQENAEWLRSTFPEDGRADEERAACWFAIVQPEGGELIGEIGLVGILAEPACWTEHPRAA